MIKVSDNLVYVHSAKRFCIMVPELPEGAEFYALHTSTIPKGMILEDSRYDRGYTLYHVHLKNGSNPKKYGKYGKHEVYILRDPCYN